MQPVELILGAFLVFLLIGGGLLLHLVRRGKNLCSEFARRLPARYEELGRPCPGFLHSPRRTAYFRFVFQREFVHLEDPYLVEQFRRLRSSELRQLVFLLVGFGVLGMAALWYELVHTA